MGVPARYDTEAKEEKGTQLLSQRRLAVTNSSKQLSLTQSLGFVESRNHFS